MSFIMLLLLSLLFVVIYFCQEVLPITVKYADWELERLGNFLMLKEFLVEPFLDCKPET